MRVEAIYNEDDAAALIRVCCDGMRRWDVLGFIYDRGYAVDGSHVEKSFYTLGSLLDEVDYWNSKWGVDIAFADSVLARLFCAVLSNNEREIRWSGMLELRP